MSSKEKIRSIYRDIKEAFKRYGHYIVFQTASIPINRIF